MPSRFILSIFYWPCVYVQQCTYSTFESEGKGRNGRKEWKKKTKAPTLTPHTTPHRCGGAMMEMTKWPTDRYDDTTRRTPHNTPADCMTTYYYMCRFFVCLWNIRIQTQQTNVFVFTYSPTTRPVIHLSDCFVMLLRIRIEKMKWFFEIWKCIMSIYSTQYINPLSSSNMKLLGTSVLRRVRMIVSPRAILSLVDIRLPHRTRPVAVCFCLCLTVL